MTRRIALHSGSEFALIERVARLATGNNEVLVGIGDDCAVLRDGLVISVDTSVEGVHFQRAWLEPADIGYRAAAVALSDLAAMAATPIAMLVAISLPGSDYGDADQIMAGVALCADQYHAVIAGGDTTRTAGPLSLSITVLGRAESPVLRSGAHAGDLVWVTGKLGGAAAAVHAWSQGAAPELGHRQAFQRPSPRIEPALWLHQRVHPSAMLDLSDGLAGDSAHICAASGVAIVLEAELIPVAPRATFDQALSGGDDYELCFTAAPDSVAPQLDAFRERFGLDLTRAGTVTAGAGLSVVDAMGRAVAIRAGYDHFMDAAR